MNEPVHHVLFVVNSYPPRVGGLENHVASLASRLVDSGHRASVVTIGDGPASASVSERGVRVTRVKGILSIASVISFPLPGTTRRIVRLMENEKVTAVSTHTRFFPMSLVGLAVAKRLGVPLLHTEHGSAHVRGVAPLIAIASRIVDMTMGRAVLRGASVVLAVSEDVATFVWRLAGVRSTLFYNAIDLPANMQNSTHPEPEICRFVFVGRIVPGKGWEDMLGAASLIVKKNPSMRFTVEILGDGPDLHRLAEQVDRAGLEAVVMVRGRVSQAEVFAVLRGAVLVNPTRLAEGFQTTLLEALAAGGQIVTYPAPGVDRLRADGAPVWIAESTTVEELAELMVTSTDRPLPALSERSLSQWTWPERARQYLELLAEV